MRRWLTQYRQWWPEDIGPGLARHGQLLLAVAVLGAVAVMLVPLPPSLLDLLISLGLALSLLLLLVAVYAQQPLRLSSLPTLILVGTLFRTALSIAISRAILTAADGGAVVRAFGAVVVQGDLVVGAAVFVTLTLAQLVVVSKGSERAAEVAARFALDALPGKQMAIDSDLRAGSVSADQAGRRRQAVARESQFYGAMDGAMKFVRGDAVATLAISGVNLAGGLAIGALRQEMDLSAALHTYGLLAIGAGLVAQVQGLLSTTCAGLVLTGVAGEPSAGDRGAGESSASGQLLGEPRAVLLAASLLAILGLVPGLPHLPFLLLAALGGLVGFGLWRQRGSAGVTRAGRQVFAHRRQPVAWLDLAAPGDRSGPETEIPPLPPIVLELGAELGQELAGQELGVGRAGRWPGPAPTAPAWLTRLSVDLFEELGVPLPPIEMQVRAETAVLAPRGYRVLLHGSALAEGTVPPAAGAGVEPLAAAAGAAEAVRVHLWALLRRHAHELLGVAETQRLLDGLASSHRALVREVVPKVVSPALLASVLRRLLEEGVSIRDLRGILEALAARAETPGIDRDPALAAEQVRPALRRWLTLRHAVRAGASAGPGARAGSGPGPLTVAAILIDPEIEEAIRDAVQRSPRGSVLTLEPEVVHDFLAVLRHQLEAQQPALAAAPASGQPAAPASGPAAVSPVVLTAADIRRFVRRLVEVEHPDLAVLSYPELLPDTRVEPAGRITPG